MVLGVQWQHGMWAGETEQQEFIIRDLMSGSNIRVGLSQLK